MEKQFTFIETLVSQIEKYRLVPVVVLEREEDALPLAEALKEGGLPIMEVTFRTEAAAGAIRKIVSQCPEVIVGAGTVLSVSQAEEAIKAGARFIVSPGLNPQVVAYCLDREIPVLPGCVTPGEIETALSLGLTAVKFFPAEPSGGVGMLKALSAPYRNVRFMPTGGITEENIGGYLALPSVIGCGGSWIVKEDLIRKGAFQTITQLTRSALQKICSKEETSLPGSLSFPERPIDFACLGEVMLRLSPMGNDRFDQGNCFERVIGGSELNVAAGIGAMGHRTAFLTKLPATPIGSMVKKTIRGCGVDDSFVVDDTSDEARLGLYYYERGPFPRKPTVCYDRRNSSVTTLLESEIDPSVYQRTKIFHVSGISLALGDDLRREIMKMVKKAKAEGAFITFDVNYRANLWSEEDAKKAVEEILPLVDGFFVSEETSRRLMGRKGSLKEILKAYAADYGLTFVATTRREAASAEYHHFSSLLYSSGDEAFYEELPYRNIRVIDRVGSGDAYLSGVLSALLEGKDFKQAVSFGNALAAIKCTVNGDMLLTSPQEVKMVIEEHRFGSQGEMNR